MGGGATTSTTGGNTVNTTQNPWDPSVPALKSILTQGRHLLNNDVGVTPGERNAFGDMFQNANYANKYMGAQKGLVSDLYGGGGFGLGKQNVINSMKNAQGALNPYLSQNYLDPMTNPYLQPSIDAARNQSMNSIADRFSAAGRSFSGAESDAMGRGMTSAALPMLLGQYNQDVGAQQNAAGQVVNNAVGGSAALDAMQNNVLKARMAAPGQISNINIPQNMYLDAAMRERNIPINALQGIASTILPIAGVGSTGSSVGTMNGSSTQGSNPFQTAVGGGLGLLGMFGGGW